jgi:Tfp pilus assembly PilM family ATPase
MGFAMFSAQASPIAIDFGSASVKLLQIGAGEERPPLLAAAEVPVPDSIRSETDRLFAFYGEWLPKILRDGKFKGRRAIMAVPSAQTFVQHMQINEAEGISTDDAVKAQLQVQMGCPPSGVVVRSMQVCDVHRNGQALQELICFAMTKETIMHYVELLKRCKLEVVGVHTDTMAMIRSFDHVHRRQDDTNITTMYVDLGWGGTRVAITHGRQVMFARYIPIGGRNFDQLIASTVHCDQASARAHRLTLQARSPRPWPRRSRRMRRRAWPC